MIQNFDMGQQLLGTSQVLDEAAVELYNMVWELREGQQDFLQIMKEMLAKMRPLLERLVIEEPGLTAHFLCKNVEYSLLNIEGLIKKNPQKACHKIQYELLPLIHELYVDLYFWGFCYPDQQKMKYYYLNEMPQLCPLPLPEKEDEYKYDVSVVVLAYNKLDYTKLCMEYLKKYFPSDLNYELILINNGSTDETKAFFESFEPDKQVDIRFNTKSFSLLSRIVEGKYILFISNDALIMPNAVENMLTCIQSDDKIGCVVPTCPNTSNYQLIPVDYTSYEELIAFSEDNNKSNPYRWEQRVKLIPPVVLARNSTEGIHAFFGFRYPFHTERFLAFTDDLMSMVMRRSGYKCILAKDAYVHHFGSVTISEETKEKQDFYLIGRRAYYSAFGIDPWDKTSCYDPLLINALCLEKEGPVNILGVNCGMGSNSLKVKEQLTENMGRRDILVYNISNQSNFKQDLEGVSDRFQFLEDWNYLNEVFSNICFSYIIVENMDQNEYLGDIMKHLYSRLSSGGQMAIRSEDIDFQNRTKELFTLSKQSGSWVIVEKNQ